MLILLQPLWLMAMAGILFPVLLHLWNERQGRVMRVGSIVLLEKRAPRQSWNRRLSEWWLLVLRCLLLMAVALLLAGPLWKHSATGEKKGWILAEAGAGPHFTTLIDSLLKAGYERHSWGRDNYWDQFRAADRGAPAGVSFYLFTSAWAGRFGGMRPVTERAVHWYTYTPEDSVSHWIGGAWLSSSDSVRVAEGSSGPTGTFYRYRMAGAGQMSVQMDSQPPVKVDTTVIRVAIYSDPAYLHDSRYLAATVRALEQFDRKKIQLNVGTTADVNAVGSLPRRKGDWLFWLSSRPLPAGTWDGNVLQYAPIAKGVEVSGRTLLHPERGNGGPLYRFYSRFDPDWNELVWERSFPVMMERLLFGESNRGLKWDRRVLDPEQIAPEQIAPVLAGMNAAADARVGATVDATVDAGTRGRAEKHLVDPAPAIWILILLLFIAERVVAYGIDGRKK
jgi:Aerotolerance regulator N-terminal